jgi:hypothetical protein
MFACCFSKTQDTEVELAVEPIFSLKNNHIVSGSTNLSEGVPGKPRDDTSEATEEGADVPSLETTMDDVSDDIILSSGSQEEEDVNEEMQPWERSRCDSLLSALEYEDVPVRRPPIGGCVGIREHHSEFLLPPEVVLFEPSPEEIFDGGNADGGKRQIFLNTPLTKTEIASLRQLHDKLQKATGGDGSFPEYMAPHALRILQQSKFDTTKAMHLMEMHLTDRVQRLPIKEGEVLEDLRKGFMYWHGRDDKCRPCLVIRLERMGELINDSERCIRMVIFVLEYAIKFAMAPGRVENWVVILDLANVTSVFSFLRIPGIISTACAIANALENIYCGRMAWMQIVNMPGKHGTLTKLINKAIPAEKKHKVNIVNDGASALRGRFARHQVERRYGGTAPDLEAHETYPFRFFPNATSSTEGMNQTARPEEESEPRQSSLHALTSRPFQQGVLWDTSSTAAQDAWMSQPQSLTKPAAEALAALPRGRLDAKPCCSVDRWVELAWEAHDARAAQEDDGSVRKQASWNTSCSA